MKSPQLLAILSLIAAAQSLATSPPPLWPPAPPAPPRDARDDRCLVYNEASLLVASLAATTENAMLTFGKYTYTIIEEVSERIGQIIRRMSALGEHLCAEVWRLRAGNQWFTQYMLFEPLEWLADHANGTLHSVGTNFTELGSTVQRDLYTHTELVGKRLLAGVAQFIREVRGDLHNVTAVATVSSVMAQVSATLAATRRPAAAAPKRRAPCRLGYAEASSLAIMKQMNLFVVQCVVGYGQDVLDRLAAIDVAVDALWETVRERLDGMDVVEQEQASEVYNEVWNGIGVAMDNLAISNATIFSELETLGTNISKCTDGIVERMHAFIKHVRQRIVSCRYV